MGLVVHLGLTAAASAQIEGPILPPPRPLIVPAGFGPLPSVSDLAREETPALAPVAEVVGLPQKEPGHKPDEDHHVPPMPCVFAEADWLY
jgi:hypothetical protein